MNRQKQLAPGFSLEKGLEDGDVPIDAAPLLCALVLCLVVPVCALGVLQGPGGLPVVVTCNIAFDPRRCSIELVH